MGTPGMGVIGAGVSCAAEGATEGTGGAQDGAGGEHDGVGVAASLPTTLGTKRIVAGGAFGTAGAGCASRIVTVFTTAGTGGGTMRITFAGGICCTKVRFIGFANREAHKPNYVIPSIKKQIQ